MSNTVRTPEQIKSLYERLKEKKAKQGINYTQKDFTVDLGYSGKARFNEITSGKWKISTRVDRLMDFIEEAELK